MDISPNALRKETVGVLNEINTQINIVKNHAELRGMTIDTMDPTLMVSLLLGKAQCLHTLTLLNEQARRR